MSNDTDLQAEVTNLVFREAMLLDRRRWDDWIDLYTEDATYWVPAWANEEDTTNDPDTQLNLIYLRNRGGLEDRIFRIETRDSYASYPLDRTVHVVSNVLVENSEGDIVEATANCLVHSYGKKGSVTRGGMYDFTLTRINGDLKISRKKIVFIDDRLEGPIDVYHL
jgi:3-phenylpropionate/cinnamic acid dioxygenase small subunit